MSRKGLSSGSDVPGDLSSGAGDPYVQDVAIEVSTSTSDSDSSVHVKYMSTLDARVTLEPSNKIIVTLDTDPQLAAEDFVKKREY